MMKEEDSDEENMDAFSRPRKVVVKKKRSALKPSVSAKNPIKIVLKGIDTPMVTSRVTKTESSLISTTIDPTERSSDIDNAQDSRAGLDVGDDIGSDEEDQVEDTLAFFQDSHEDQDPAYQAFVMKMAEEERQKKLAILDAKDQQIRKEIEEIVSELYKDKQAATDRSVERFKQRAADDEKIRTERYQELYRQQTASNIRKINEGIEILQQRHQKDLQTALGHHQQQVRNRRLTEQMAAAEWHATSQSIVNRHNVQIQGFRNKGNDLKKKTESDYQREHDKIQKQHLIRLQEVDHQRQKINTRLYQQMQQLRQRYLKRHLQKWMKEKEELLSQGPAVAISANAEGSTTMEHDDTGDGGDFLSSSLRTVATATTTMTTRDQQTKSTSSEERAELNPSSPIRSAEKWVEELHHPLAGAATRHKHRKGVMNQVVRQLAIEIHNEGLWFSPCPVDTMENSNEKKNDTTPASPPLEYEFLPWGVKAHQILDTIVSGEIPPGICEVMLSKHANAAELMTVQAGQVRCVVSDLRTSEETASSQRVQSLALQDESHLKELDQKIAETQRIVTEAENACARAVQEEKDKTTAAMDASENMKKATKLQDEFKQKFKRFLGPDGNPIPEASPSERQDLSTAMSRYNNDLETATTGVKNAKQSLSEAKAQVQRLQAVVKNAQKTLNAVITEFKKKQALVASMAGSRGDKNSSRQSDTSDAADRAYFRVRDIIGALRKTADRRRDLADQKKSTSFSSAWVQSFPGLPSSLKKSLWHKMHRRKQQIILRPAPESFIAELKTHVANVVAAKHSGRSTADRMKIIEAEQLRAEQLFLVAMHPLADENIGCVPPAKSSNGWAEPGWQLNLSVPNDDVERSQMILPCARSFPVLETNLSEIASAPGRQASSLLRPFHFSCLESPLSTFAVASSPAESNTSLTNIRAHNDSDPLHVTEEEMSLGYAFSLKQQVSKPASQRRRTSASKVTVEPEAPAEAASSVSGTTASSDGPSKGHGSTKPAEPKKTEPKRRRSSSKKATTTTTTAAPRAKKSKQDATPSTPANAPGAPHFNQMMQQSQTLPPQPNPQQQQPQQPPPQQHQQQQQHQQPQRQPQPSHHQQQPPQQAQQQRPHMPLQQQQVMQQQQQQQQQQRPTQHHAVQRHQPPHLSQQHQQQHPPPQLQQQHMPPHQQPQHPPHPQQQHQPQHPAQIPHPQQQQYSPQMAQIRMMQQQQVISPRHQQVPANYPPQAMQQMQQFYAPLNHPPPTMHMQGRSGPPHPPPQQQMPGQPGQQPRKPGQNDSNDPLFLLK